MSDEGEMDKICSCHCFFKSYHHHLCNLRRSYRAWRLLSTLQWIRLQWFPRLHYTWAPARDLGLPDPSDDFSWSAWCQKVRDDFKMNDFIVSWIFPFFSGSATITGFSRNDDDCIYQTKQATMTAVFLKQKAAVYDIVMVPTVNNWYFQLKWGHQLTRASNIYLQIRDKRHCTFWHSLTRSWHACSGLVNNSRPRPYPNSPFVLPVSSLAWSADRCSPLSGREC